MPPQPTTDHPPPLEHLLKAAADLAIEHEAGKPQTPLSDSFRKLLTDSSAADSQPAGCAREAGRLLELLRADMQAGTDLAQASRQTAEARATAPAATAAGALAFKPLQDECQQLIAEDTALIARSRDDASRDAMLPNGKYYDFTRLLSGKLTEEDLTYHDEHKATLVRPKEEVVTELQSRIVRRLFADFEDEASLVNDALEATVA